MEGVGGVLGPLEATWRHLGEILCHLGGILEGSWGHLGDILRHLGGIWGVLGGSWRLLGAIFEACELVKQNLSKTLKNQRFFKVFEIWVGAK